MRLANDILPLFCSITLPCVRSNVERMSAAAHMLEGLSADSEEKREPVSDIDAVWWTV
jgi:hypothetical protein